MKRDRRSELVESAMSLLSSRPNLSMAELAKMMGVGRSTLHRHFKSREALQIAVARRAMEEAEEAIKPIDWDGLNMEQASEALFKVMTPLGDRFHFLSTQTVSGIDPEVCQDYTRQMQAMLAFVDKLKKAALIDESLNDEWMMLVIDALIYSAWSAVDNGYLAAREAPKLVYRTIFSGVAGPAFSGMKKPQLKMPSFEHRVAGRTAMLDQFAMMLSDDPYMSLSELALASGLSKASIHRYFHRRDDLLAELSLKSLDESEAVSRHLWGVDCYCTEKFLLLVDVLVPLGEKYDFLSDAWSVMDHPEICRRMDKQWTEMEELVDGMKAEGGVAMEVPSAWIVSALDTLMYAAWSAIKDGVVARRDVPDMICACLFGGLSPRE